MAKKKFTPEEIKEVISQVTPFGDFPVTQWRNETLEDEKLLAKLAKEIPAGSELKFRGTEAIVLRTPQDTAIRIGFKYDRGTQRSFEERPDIEGVLQPIRSKWIGDTLVEELPWVHSLQKQFGWDARSNADIVSKIDQLKGKISGQNYDPKDLTDENIGMLESGDLTVLDPGAVSKKKMADGGQVEDDPLKTTEPGGRDKIDAELAPGEVVVTKEQMASLRSVLTSHDPGLSPGSLVGMPDESIGGIIKSQEVWADPSSLGNIEDPEIAREKALEDILNDVFGMPVSSPEMSLADVAKTEIKNDTMIRPDAKATMVIPSPLAVQFEDQDIQNTQGLGYRNPMPLEYQEKGLEQARMAQAQGTPSFGEMAMALGGYGVGESDMEEMSNQEIIDTWKELQEMERERARLERGSLARSPDISAGDISGSVGGSASVATELAQEASQSSLASEPPVGTMLPGDVDDQGNIVSSGGDDDDWSIPAPPVPPPLPTDQGDAGGNQGNTSDGDSPGGGRVRKSPVWDHAMHQLGGAGIRFGTRKVGEAIGLPHEVTGALGSILQDSFLGKGDSNLLGGGDGLQGGDQDGQIAELLRELIDEVTKLREDINRTKGEPAGGPQPDGSFVPTLTQSSEREGPSMSLRRESETDRMLDRAMQAALRAAEYA